MLEEGRLATTEAAEHKYPGGTTPYKPLPPGSAPGGGNTRSW